MIGVLLSIVLSGYTYDVRLDCNELAKVYFPLDDTKEHRVLFLCMDYPDENTQLIDHELIHICMHSHTHKFSNQEGLDNHLHRQVYGEEQIAVTVAPCIVANRDKLYSALESATHERISGYGPRN